MKGAFIDLDGIVADPTKRLEIAQKVKDTFVNDLDRRLVYLVQGKDIEKEGNDLYWQTVFNPDLVDLDTLIPGASKGLIDIEAEGYRAIYLSSRIEIMRKATRDWLEKTGMRSDQYGFQREMVLMPPRFKQDYTKTVTWKIGTIQQLAALFEMEEVLLVDDSPAIRAALDNAGMPFSFQTREKL